MTTLILLVLAAGLLALWWAAGLWDARRDRQWLEERAAEGDWAALERWRWHTSDGVLRARPDRLPGRVEAAYMQALADGDHEETSQHGGRY